MNANSELEDDESTDSETEKDEVSQMYRSECQDIYTSLGLSDRATEMSNRPALEMSSEDRVDIPPSYIAAVSIHRATRLTGKHAPSRISMVQTVGLEA